MSERLVIIGAGMATAYLLQALSGQQHHFHITIIGDEVEFCYNRVMLSGLLAGEKSAGDLSMLESVGASAQLRVISGSRVTAINLAGQSIDTDQDETFRYDRLVLATGAKVARPSLDCDGIGGIEELRTLHDALRLRKRAADGGRAIVMGGGLLGLEAAHGLNQLGFDTSVLHRRSWLMNRQLDREGGLLLQQTMEKQGITFHLDAAVASLLSPEQKLAGLHLQDGRQLPCDLLVFATGIAPHKSLAEAAGLETERGILVDPYMRTSDPHCFALGECSQLGDRCFGLVAPIQAQASVLARHLLAAEGPGFESDDTPTQLKISGVQIFSVGALEEEGEALVLRDRSAGIYRRLVVQGTRLVSAVLVGDKRDGNWYHELIRNQRDISAYRHQLMFGRETCEATQMTAQAA